MDVWIGRDGERHGPYQESELRSWLRDGQVSPDDLAWYEGLSDWTKLRQLFPADVPQSTTPPLTATAPPLAPKPLPGQGLPVELELAGFWHRFGAWVVDLLVLMVPGMVLYYLMHLDQSSLVLLNWIKNGGSLASLPTDPAAATAYSQYKLFSAIYVVIGFVYYAALEGSRLQATLGKRAVGLIVTDVHGQRLNLRRSAIRNAVRLLNLVTGLLPLAFYIPVAWTRRHQGLHDMLANALVVAGRVPGRQVPTGTNSHPDR